MLPHFQAVLFDMDGTLVDSLPFIFTAIQDTFAHFTGRHYTEAEITAMFGPTEAGLIAQRVPPEIAEEAVQYFYERYAALHPRPSQPFPGILALLRDLRARGIKTGVVTGKGTHTLEISMQAYGLEEYIDATAAGSPQRGEKPQAIRRMLANWGINPEAAAYVGDLPSDLAAARQAGVTALGAAWANPALAAEDRELVFSSVGALHGWLCSS